MKRNTDRQQNGDHMIGIHFAACQTKMLLRRLFLLQNILNWFYKK